MKILGLHFYQLIGKLMIKKIFFLGFFVLPLFSQGLNHSEKIVIKRNALGLKLSGEIDYRTNETGLYHRHYDLGTAFSLGETWTANIQFRSVYRMKDGQWKLEKRPHGQIQKTLNTDAVKWTIKSRQEYRIRVGQSNAMRNRFRIMGKSNRAWKNLKPYIANEFFYDMDKKKYNKNWVMVGFDLTKSKIGLPSIYYKYVTDLVDGKWVSTYMMVFKVTI